MNKYFYITRIGRHQTSIHVEGCKILTRSKHAKHMSKDFFERTRGSVWYDDCSCVKKAQKVSS